MRLEARRQRRAGYCASWPFLRFVGAGLGLVQTRRARNTRGSQWPPIGPRVQTNRTWIACGSTHWWAIYGCRSFPGGAWSRKAVGPSRPLV